MPSFAVPRANDGWVGRALNLDTVQNRLWFTLRHGSCAHRTLQAAWNAHGPGAFALDIIERLDDETLGYVRDRALKDRLAHWVQPWSQKQSRAICQLKIPAYDVIRIVLPSQRQSLCSKGRRSRFV